MRALAIALLTAAQLTPTAAAQDQPLPAPTPAFAFLHDPPTGLPAMPLEGPPPTEAMFELGRRLFADAILSRDRSVSCQTCHPPQLGFASPDKRPAGVDGRRAKLHAPALLNRGYGKFMRWDGRTTGLETFVLEPIEDPNEMDLPLGEALQRLRDDPGYREGFTSAFEDGVNAANLATCLSTFVRGIVTGDSPVDRFQRGQHDALTPQQRRGLWLFESKGGCWRCHPAPLFTDESFHNTGVGVIDGQAKPGRSAVTQDPADRGRFKTPTLRGVRLTAPFMHDGSIETLDELIEFYARGGNANDQLDAQLRPLQLNAKDKASLKAFLEAL